MQILLAKVVLPIPTQDIYVRTLFPASSYGYIKHSPGPPTTSISRGICSLL